MKKLNDQQVSSNLAWNLRMLRKKHQLSQAALADRWGVKRYNINAYETGRAQPKVRSLAFLCRLFAYTLDEFIATKLPV